MGEKPNRILSMRISEEGAKVLWGIEGEQVEV